jgi:general stress protein CsbA
MKGLGRANYRQGSPIIWRVGIFFLAGVISALLVYLCGNFGPALGVVTLTALACLLGSLILMLQSIVVLLARAAGRFIKPWPFWNVFLDIGSVTVGFLILETLLGVQVAQTPKAKDTSPVIAPLILPDHWAKRKIEVAPVLLEH